MQALCSDDYSIEYVAKTFDLSKVQPFSTSILNEEKKIYLPKNYLVITKSNYLARNFVKICLEQGYKVVSLDRDAEPLDEMKGQVKSFIKGWVTTLVDKVPAYAKNLQKDFKEGVLFGLHLLLEKAKVDRSLVKPTTVDDVNVLLFGSAWKTKYAVEKSMIDLLKHFTRTSTVRGDISSWVVSKEQVIEKYGLKDPLKDQQIINENEQAFLRSQFKLPLDALKGIEGFTEFQARAQSQSDEKSIDVFRRYIGSLKDVQKMLKPLKDIVEKEVSDRSNFVFKHKANKNAQRLGRTWKEQLDAVRPDPQCGNVLNPSFIYSVGKEKLNFPVASEQREIDRQVGIIHTFCQQYNVSPAKEAEIASWFFSKENDQ
jgi:hypothetical protein